MEAKVQQIESGDESEIFSIQHERGGHIHAWVTEEKEIAREVAGKEKIHEDNEVGVYRSKNNLVIDAKDLGGVTLFFEMEGELVGLNLLRNDPFRNVRVIDQSGNTLTEQRIKAT